MSVGKLFCWRYLLPSRLSSYMLMDSSTRSPIFAFARLMQKRASHCVRRPATLPPPLGIHILKLIAYDLFKSMISFYFSLFHFTFSLHFLMNMRWLFMYQLVDERWFSIFLTQQPSKWLSSFVLMFLNALFFQAQKCNRWYQYSKATPHLLCFTWFLGTCTSWRRAKLPVPS